MRRTLIALLWIGVSGCNAGERPHPSPRDSAANASTSTAVTDTTPSMDTLLRRFQAGLPHQDTLAGTSPTREALTRRYLEAVGRFDTSALRDMHITRAEYAYVYFPSSTMMRPPYELPPDVAWLLHTAESNKGIGRVMRRFGGQQLQLDSVRCPGDPRREGPNTVWRNCLVRYRAEGEPAREQPLFAAIIERNGRFKFFSYATPL